jgi:hypothetical protein
MNYTITETSLSASALRARYLTTANPEFSNINPMIEQLNMITVIGKLVPS